MGKKDEEKMSFQEYLALVSKTLADVSESLAPQDTNLGAWGRSSRASAQSFLQASAAKKAKKAEKKKKGGVVGALKDVAGFSAPIVGGVLGGPGGAAAGAAAASALDQATDGEDGFDFLKVATDAGTAAASSYVGGKVSGKVFGGGGNSAKLNPKELDLIDPLAKGGATANPGPTAMGKFKGFASSFGQEMFNQGVGRAATQGLSPFVSGAMFAGAVQQPSLKRDPKNPGVYHWGGGM